jgi:hypothetical protein
MIYILGVVLAFFSPPILLVAYFAVASMWLVPDRRIERTPREDVYYLSLGPCPASAETGP